MERSKSHFPRITWNLPFGDPPWVAGGLFLSLGWLWFRLIDHLRIEWSVNPQYAYGWAVPFLCAYLVWQRIAKSAGGEQPTESGSPPAKFPSRGFGFLPSVLCCLALAFLFAPSRLIEEANPEWRLVSWALALIVIGLTLLLLRLLLGASPFAFPFLFFLVAVPWPTLIEGRLIQWLTGANVAMTIELLGWFGIPALQHGNVIELATGVVGVDDACSGIRSFQATLMISLFFGELYSLTASRRAFCVLLGFGLSFVFNAGRTLLLTCVASRQGVAAIEKWHDPAGVSILIGCFVTLWLVSLALKPDNKERTISETVTGSTGIVAGGIFKWREAAQGLAANSTLRTVTLALAGWLVLVEVGVEWWYRSHESRMPTSVAWSAVFPADKAAFRELPFPDQTRQFLRYDEGSNCTWQEDDGTRWQGIFLRWNPGKVAVHLARSHTPEICLSAAGRKLVAKSELQIFKVNEVALPFIAYEFAGKQDRVHVFYCLWEDRASEHRLDSEELTYGKRLAPVLAGRRNSGQRSLELAVWGAADSEQAVASLRAQLEQIIRLGSQPTESPRASSDPHGWAWLRGDLLVRY